MQISLNQQVILVTGGLRGIGRTMTKSLCDAGAHVIATFTQLSPESDDFVKTLKASGKHIYPKCLDVKNTKQIDETMSWIEQEFGRLDVLINNAGIVKDDLLLSMTDEDWSAVLDTNLTGTFNMSRAAARLMMRKRQGQILNISSVAASRPGRGQVNYASSKGAIESMTKALAVELASRSIRVNCIAPGVIATEMSQEVRDAAGEKILESILVKRFGRPEEVANLATFLVSDLATYINGEVIHIDGGIKL